MKSIKRIWNSFKIAFSMYSRIPMPRSEWTDENKSYAMCFFPWIGAVIGLLSYGVFRFSKWFDGNGGGNYSLFFVIFLILFISSIVMLKKQKIKADACVKIVVCFILSILSWVLFQSAWIVVLLIIPAALGMTELLFDEI